MSRIFCFLLGGMVALFAAAAFVALGAHGFSARDQPGQLETWLARTARWAAIPSGTRARSNPVSDIDKVQEEAMAHWADHCSSCHGNDGSGDTPMGKNTYPPAPNMRLAPTQRKTDGELFFAIQNGIRFTAMPAWGNGSPRDEEDSWKLVRFIRRLPRLTAADKDRMKAMNPRTPDEFKEEQEEEKFLRGESTNENEHSREHH